MFLDGISKYFDVYLLLIFLYFPIGKKKINIDTFSILSIRVWIVLRIFNVGNKILIKSCKTVNNLPREISKKTAPIILVPTSKLMQQQHFSSLLQWPIINY